jgi:hypothetical protein
VSKSLRLNDRRPTRWIEDRTRLLEKIAPDCVSYAETRFDAPVFTLQGVGFKDSSLAARAYCQRLCGSGPPYSAMARGRRVCIRRLDVYEKRPTETRAITIL